MIIGALPFSVVIALLAVAMIRPDPRRDAGASGISAAPHPVDM
jgi:hypothetical protein